MNINQIRNKTAIPIKTDDKNLSSCCCTPPAEKKINKIKIYKCILVRNTINLNKRRPKWGLKKKI